MILFAAKSWRSMLPMASCEQERTINNHLHLVNLQPNFNFLVKALVLSVCVSAYL